MELVLVYRKSVECMKQYDKSVNKSRYEWNAHALRTYITLVVYLRKCMCRGDIRIQLAFTCYIGGMK